MVEVATAPFVAHEWTVSRMDNFTATELAYKNGYEQGKKDALKEHMKLGSCDGCYWKGLGRFQKCTYCRRNQNMKDHYLVGREFDG